MNWIITGDCHGEFSRFANLEEKYKNDETAIIVLGDFCINYLLNDNDYFKKRSFCKKYPQYFYVLRGNHEARPQDVHNMTKIYDPNVQGDVYMEPDFPRIRYFMDYGIYHINVYGKEYRIAVIGGAYSVDKWYRLEMGRRWFENEQLTQDEKIDCLCKLMGQHFDIILSHTCPLRWEPTDLFLGGIDQSTVDKSMEQFLDEVIQSCTTNLYCFGHYHADRIERPGVEQYFTEMEELHEVIARWENYRKTGELDWWIPKSPNFNQDEGVIVK